MARKGKAWGPGNPLWRWQHRRGRSRRGRGRRRRGTGTRRSTSSKRRAYRSTRSSRRHTTMARRRGRGRRGGMKLPIISLAIVGGQAAAAYDGTLLGTAKKFAEFYTGIDIDSGTFDGTKLLIG